MAAAAAAAAVAMVAVVVDGRLGGGGAAAAGGSSRSSRFEFGVIIAVAVFRILAFIIAIALLFLSPVVAS